MRYKTLYYKGLSCDAKCDAFKNLASQASQKKEGEMTEQEAIYDVIKDINDLRKRYIGVWLDDFLWERFLEEQETLSDKYKNYGQDIWLLFRKMVTALNEYKERQQKVYSEEINKALRGGELVKREIRRENNKSG
jgi:hypothetical protein